MPRGVPKNPRPKAPEDQCQFKFTTFPATIGHVNGKNVAVAFGKAENQSWWNKRKSDAQFDQERAEKRRRLVEEPEIQGGGAKGSLAKLLLDASPTAPLAPLPTPAQEISDAPGRKVIVIHPGSRYLRIGRASDESPLEVPNVIARRSRPKKTAMLPGSDSKGEENVGNLSAVTSEKATSQMTSKIEALRSIFKLRMREAKLRGPTGAVSIAAEFNLEAKAESYPQNEANWTNTATMQENFVVGGHALKIADPAKEGFTLHWPISRGRLNTDSDSSLQRVLDDIQDIWTSILQVDFEIPVQEFQDYSIILLVPDLCDQSYIRDISTLVLRTMGFKQLCIQQESICAMLGMGLSSACVVDIGAKKTSVCCVEEGWLVPESRTTLNYGGDDVTEFYAMLLRQANFPYKELDLRRNHDWQLVESLKEENCVLAESKVQLNAYTFQVKAPGKATEKYSIKLYDENILAPMCLFAPRVIDFERRANRHQFAADVVDEVLEMGGSQITTTMRNCAKLLLQHSAVPAPAEPQAISSNLQVSNTTNLSVPPAMSPRESSIDGSRQSTPRAESPAPASELTFRPTAPIAEANLSSLDVGFEASKVPLDLAIIESICSTISEDRIKKFCNAIIIVGGGGCIPGVEMAVQSRIEKLVQERFPSLPQNLVNVIPPLHDADSRELAWRGISVLTKLDVAADIFVRSDDFERLGVKAFKDRNAFL